MKKIIPFVIFLFTGMILSAQTPPPPPPPVSYGDTISRTSDAPAPPVVVKQSNPDSAVFSFAEVMPEFPGDQAEFMRYLQTNIKYPDAERTAKKQGTVYIGFIVEKNGSISNVHAVKSVTDAPGFTTEAVRVISAMPNWTPGLMNGKPVRVSVVQPVKFML